MLTVSLNTVEIPRHFSRFSELVGESHWRRRASAIKAEIRGNHFLHELLIEENDFCLAFDRLSTLIERYGQLPSSAIADRSIFPAIAFAAQVLSILDISNAQQGKQLIRRIHGAFRNPDDMRAIRLELMAATHFVRRGIQIRWPEMEGTGTFDLLVPELSSKGLQIECKSISHDKGRKIHRREALEFHRLIYRDLKRVAENLKFGLSVVLTLPGRLPTALIERKALVKQIAKAVLCGQGISFAEGGDIRISQFNAAIIQKKDSEGSLQILKSDIEKVTSTRNREAIVVGNGKSGMLIFVLQSANEDTMLDYVFNTLSVSAKTQVSKVAPAIYLVGFDGIDSEQLVHAAKQDADATQPPTALRVAVSDFLANTDRDYVVGVAFLSRSALTPRLDGEFDSGGSAYFFPKRESPLWAEDFSGLFAA